MLTWFFRCSQFVQNLFFVVLSRERKIFQKIKKNNNRRDFQLHVGTSCRREVLMVMAVVVVAVAVVMVLVVVP